MPTHQLRIIGGRWRRRQLTIPLVDGLRPTPDRVRETLFNWLGQTLPGWRVLDAFAGTGALGLEAASRGAAEVVLVESQTLAVRALQAHAQHLLGAPARQVPQIDVVPADVLAWLPRQPAQIFDLILLDPPFRSDRLEKILPSAARALHPEGRMYIEWHADLTKASAPAEQLTALNLTVVRHGQAGQVHYHLCRCTGGGDLFSG